MVGFRFADDLRADGAAICFFAAAGPASSVLPAANPVPRPPSNCRKFRRPIPAFWRFGFLTLNFMLTFSFCDLDNCFIFLGETNQRKVIMKFRKNSGARG